MGSLVYMLRILLTVCIIAVNGKYQNGNINANDYDSIDTSSIDSLSSELLNATFQREKLHKVSDSNIIKDERTKNDCGKGSNNKNCRINANKDKSPNNKSKTHRYPFTASIQRKGVHYATGALLNKRWVLTVASEFFNVRESIKFFRVRLGTINCKKGGTLVPIKSLEIHPSYQHKSPQYDISLVQLAMPVEYSEHLKPISFSKVKGKVLSAKFLTTYWPRLVVNGHVLPPQASERVKPNSMRVSTQKMIPWNWCYNLMTALNQTLDDTLLCLDPILSHHSPCLPDAGAPVTADDGLWGITSGWTSRGCPHPQSPTVFTRVTSPLMRAWLNTHINNVYPETVKTNHEA